MDLTLNVRVRFLDDNIIYDCPLRDVKFRGKNIKKGDIRKVKWEGYYYDAEILHIGHETKETEQSSSLEQGTETTDHEEIPEPVEPTDAAGPAYADDPLQVYTSGHETKETEQSSSLEQGTETTDHEEIPEPVEPTDAAGPAYADDPLQVYTSGHETKETEQSSSLEQGTETTDHEEIPEPVEPTDVAGPAYADDPLQVYTSDIEEDAEHSSLQKTYTTLQAMTTEQAAALNQEYDSSDEASSLFSSDGDKSWQPSSSGEEHRIEDNSSDDDNGNDERGEGNKANSSVIKETNETISIPKTGFGSVELNGSEAESKNSNTIFVPQVVKKGHIRVWDKKDACYFCYQIYAKLTQHLLVKHSTEPEVIDCFNSPKNSTERFNKIRVLRNKGNYLHNMKVLSAENGSLLVCRRQSKQSQASDYLPCPSCYGFFLGKKLYRHVKVCPDSKPEEGKVKQKVKLMAKMLIPTTRENKTLFEEKVLKRMRKDEVTQYVKYDETLIGLGSKLLDKFQNEPHMALEISQKMRTLAKFAMDVNKKHPNLKSVNDLLMPNAFMHIMECVKELYLLNDHPKPSKAIKIGNNLKHCAGIATVHAIIKGDKAMREKLQDFLLLYKNEWLSSVSVVAQSQIHEGRFNKPVGIPEEEDIMLFNQYIIAKENKYVETNFEGAVYSDVTKNTLAHVITFNRRRVGEVQRLKVKAYLERMANNKPFGVIEETLSEADRERGSQLQRVEVKGKKGNKSPIMFTPNMVKCINFILDQRKHSGVQSSNPYVFACPFAEFFYRGTDVIRAAAKASGAKDLSFLNSRGLRKHVATISQLFNLKKNELDCLVQYMGHSMDVHNDYYKMPDEVMQKTQISKLFYLLESGKARECTGKTLSDMDTVLSGPSKQKNTILQSNKRPRKTNAENPSTSRRTEATDQEMSNDSFSDDSSKETSRKKIKLVDKTRKTVKKIVWTLQDKEVIKNHFRECIMKNKPPPGKIECEAFQKLHPRFQKVEWTKIKFLVYNLPEYKRARMGVK